MSRDSMPADVRERIRALFPRPPPTPEQVRAATLAKRLQERGVTTAALLASVDATSPELGDYARWIVATGGRGDLAPIDRAGMEREIRSTMAALRVLSYRRELARLETYLADAPSDAAARGRVRDLTTAARDVERRFPGSGQRAQMELAREAGAPARRAPLAPRNTDEQETT